MAHDYPSLDREIAIGSVTARNRIMMATHGPRLSQPRYLRYLDERARGGIGLAGLNVGVLGTMSVPFGPGKATPGFSFAEGDGVPPHPLSSEGRAYYDALVPTVRDWASAVKAHGVLAVGQLYHPGSAQHSDGFMPIVSSSPIVDEYERHRPHVLTGDEIGDLIQSYGEAGRRVRDAGYDLIEIHSAHGYLIEQFLSPLLNTRTDGWGGSFDNRVRLLVEIIEAVHAGVGGEIPVGIRLTGPEPEGGLSADDIAAIAARAERAGAAYISLSGGTYSGLWKGAGQAYVASALTPPGPNVPAAAVVRKALGIPLMVGGSIVSMDQAERIVADGAADIVCMVRALMAEPELVAKAFSGTGEPRPCIGGNECHYGRPVACAVNPATGREAAMEPTSPTARKRVVVLGGGPAGLECALAAARRGHEVVLAERRDRLGGRLNLLARTSQQARFGDYVSYTVRQVERAGIEVHLDKDGDPDWVRSQSPDALIIATGSLWSVGLGINADAALGAPERLGQHVLVAGGLDDHLPPLVVADWLARAGKTVTLATELASPGVAVESASLYALLRRLHERGVAILPFTAVTGRGTIRNTLTNAQGEVDGIDDIVEVNARIADAASTARYAGTAPEIHLIGDALSPRRMLHATLDGARMGLQL